MSTASFRLATLGILVSTLTLVAILVTVPMLVLKTGNLRVEIEEMSSRFKEKSDRVWKKMVSVNEQIAVPKIIEKEKTYFSFRNVRSPWEQHVCQGCHSLACPMGTPGSSGAPGPDGLPGDTGKQGLSGDDGFDVQLQPEEDQPCVICPAGPPGLRGPQGERGRTGEKGGYGVQGPEGIPGTGGPPGNQGPPGGQGLRGSLGPQGPPGDVVVAGTGIKGPKGPPGSVGPKGPPGVKGRPSKEMGAPGKQGPIGPPGAIGRGGELGPEGSFGTPGEHGEPASYCPSDCGVSHILAPGSIKKIPQSNIGEQLMGNHEATYPGTK